MSTILGYPTYKEVLVALINEANQAWLPVPFKPAGLVLEQIGYEASSQVATLRVTAPHSRYFKSSECQYVKWDFARVFQGITLPLKIEEGTLCSEVLGTFCQMYNLPLFTPADFTDPSFLTKQVNYVNDRFTLEAPFADTAMGWAGTLRIVLDSGAMSLADHVTVTKAQFRYPDTPEVGKASLRFLSTPLDFTETGVGKNIAAVGVGYHLTQSDVELLVPVLLDAGAYRGDNRIAAETALFDALINSVVNAGGLDSATGYLTVMVTTNPNTLFYGMAVLSFKL
jgi:hypothetical protein